jgi:hypothetical protein
MASIYDYTFNQMSRIGNDSTDLSERNIQNANSANYLLENLNTSCPMNKAISFATSQPDVYYSGGYTAGCFIDQSSDLERSLLSKPKTRISLNQRPYLTVPYLGRGQSNVVLETQMLQGADLANNRKSANPSSELSYVNYSSTPLIPSVQATINNPSNLIESIAAEGWIRGGLPSRELARDKDYTQVYTKN